MKLSNKQTSVFSFPIDINDNNTLTGRISKGGGGGGEGSLRVMTWAVWGGLVWVG